MIFVARDGTQLGTFSPEEVRDGLRTGRFLPDDSYFVEGMGEWRPIGEWVQASVRRTSWRIPAVLGCGALAVGGLIIGGALTFFLLMRPGKPSEPFPQTMALFRTGMLHNWQATVHRYGSDDVRQQFGQWSVDVWSPVAPEVAWSYWFNTAIFTGVALDSARPRTAFYHPWSDTFWLAEWDLASKPRITRSWFGAGDVLRSSGRPPWDPSPLWLRGGGSRADALAAALSLSIPAAETALSERRWPEGDEARRGSTSLCRVMLLQLMSDIISFRQPQDGEAAALARLRKELEDLLALGPKRLTEKLRAAPENTSEGRVAIAAMPDALAESLQPVCRLGVGRTAVIILMPSQSTDVALATVWDSSAAGARLLRVDVLPFAQLLAAARSGGRS